MKILGLLTAGILAVSITPVPVSAEPETRISPFSGKPVPRFESLRHETVNGRTGPSTDYAIAWRYERVGLPVMILEESPQWRRVRDPQGDEVWVHARMLSSEATGIISQDVTMTRGIGPESRELAVLQAGVVVDILEAREDWFKVRKVGPRNGLSGWVKQADVWGSTTR